MAQKTDEERHSRDATGSGSDGRNEDGDCVPEARPDDSGDDYARTDRVCDTAVSRLHDADTDESDTRGSESARDGGGSSQDGVRNASDAHTGSLGSGNAHVEADARSEKDVPRDDGCGDGDPPPEEPVGLRGVVVNIRKTRACERERKAYDGHTRGENDSAGTECPLTE